MLACTFSDAKENRMCYAESEVRNIFRQIQEMCA